jgi:hypothetical protein
MKLPADLPGRELQTLKRACYKTMAGRLLTNEAARRREQNIELWMLATIDDGGIDRYDSLHVNRIDDCWNSRDSWIAAGAEAYTLGLSVRHRLGLRLSLVLAFSLTDAAEPPGVDFSNQEQLEDNLNWMPPALYLFRPGEEFYALNQTRASNITVQELAPSTLISSAQFKACYYMEFKPAGSEEYSRSIFFEG